MAEMTALVMQHTLVQHQSSEMAVADVDLVVLWLRLFFKDQLIKTIREIGIC